jgi:hypothetical protein
MPEAIAIPEVHAVGLWADVQRVWRTPADSRRDQIRAARLSLREHWRERSYWAGYAATIDGVRDPGYGWTQRRARLDLAYIIATLHWASHDECGAVDLVADVGRRSCMVCMTATAAEEWTPLPAGEVDGR